MEVVAEGLKFPEGPVALDDGSVLVVEIMTGTIARIDPSNGDVERIAHTGGGPNGAALGPDGRLYVANNGGFEWTVVDGIARVGLQPQDYTGGSIQVVDLASGQVDDLYTECNGLRLRGPNDLVFDEDGGFYFSDLGKTRARERDLGAVYYAKADGSALTEIIFPMNTPNGVGLSPGGDVLYVAESSTTRLFAYPVAAPGIVSEGGSPLLYTLPGPRGFDSLAVEEGGNVAIAAVRGGGVAVVSPDGQLVEFVEIKLGDPMVTNICFAGPDRRTAFITVSGRGLLYQMDWPRAGLRLAH